MTGTIVGVVAALVYSVQLSQAQDYARNVSLGQLDWSGGAGISGPVSAFGNRFHTAQDVNFFSKGRIRLRGEAATPLATALAIPPMTLLPNLGYHALRRADFDHDGHDEIVAAGGCANYAPGTPNECLYVLKRSPSGGMQVWATVSSAEVGYWDIRTGDLDNDGDLDIAVAFFYGLGANDGRVAWFENLNSTNGSLGDGSDWGPARVLGNQLYGTDSIDIADLDGDGHADDILSGTSLNHVWANPQHHADAIAWINSNHLGTAFVERPIDSNFVTYSVRAADIDGDGRVDAVGAGGYHDIVWWKNLGNGASWGPRILVEDFYSSADSVDVVDMDHDGDLDIVAAGNAPIPAWWRNLGNGAAWSSRQNLGNNPIFGLESTIQALDLDGDGDIDFALTANHGNATYSTAWIENDGGGVSSQFPTHILDNNLSGWYSHLEVADTDGDGLTEIFSTRESTQYGSPAFERWDFSQYRPIGALESSVARWTGASPLSQQRVYLDAKVPANTQLGVTVRFSSDGVNFTPYMSVVDNLRLSAAGALPTHKYLQYGVGFISSSTLKATPELKGIAFGR